MIVMKIVETPAFTKVIGDLLTDLE